MAALTIRDRMSSLSTYAYVAVLIKTNQIIFNNRRTIWPFTELYRKQIMTVYMTIDYIHIQNKT